MGIDVCVLVVSKEAGKGISETPTPPRRFPTEGMLEAKKKRMQIPSRQDKPSRPTTLSEASLKPYERFRLWHAVKGDGLLQRMSWFYFFTYDVFFLTSKKKMFQVRVSIVKRK